MSFRNGGEGNQDRPKVGYVVQNQDHWVFHWIFAGTNLHEGDAFGVDEEIVGYEADGANFDRSQGPPFVPKLDDGTPATFVILGVGDVSVFGGTDGNRAATMGVYTNAGTVFTGATTDWPRVVALNGEPNTVQITRNVLDGLSGKHAIALITDVSPAVAGVGNNVYFFAKSLDGHIFYNRAVLGQGGQGWIEVAGDGRTNVAPAAGAVGTHVFVALKGLDGKLYLNQTDLGHTFGQWFPMHFSTDVAPAVAGVGDNVYFFAKSLDGRIFYNRAVLGQGGQGWIEVDGGGRTDVAPATGAVGTHVFVAMKGLDGNLYLNQADLGHTFGQWFPMDFSTDVAPAVAGVGDNVYFFAKSLDGRIFYNRAVLGQGGQGWLEVDGGGRTDVAPAAGAVGTHVFVAMKGLDGNLYLNQADLRHTFGQWFLMT